MARGHIALRVGALVLIWACSSDEEATAPVTAPAPAATATHGGTLVALARHRVELVAHETGEVLGYVVDSSGDPLARPEGALLTVTPTLDADHVRPVLLRWNGEARRYEARLRDAPVEGPADISLVVSGRPERGSIDRLPVQPALEGSAVAYAEEPEEPEGDDAIEDEEDEEAEGEGEANRGRRGRRGSLRARARRLFGL